jgi:hypothetical protein
MQKVKTKISKNNNADQITHLLIEQLTKWFIQNSDFHSQYAVKSLLSSKSKYSKNKICKEKDTGSLLVLKSFNNIDRIQSWEKIAFELIIPILLKSENILKHNSIRIFKNVIFISYLNLRRFILIMNTTKVVI